MGTAIVSTAFALDGREVLSRVLLVLAAALWVVLAGVAADRFVRDRRRVAAEARTVGALTLPAGTAVLGTRLALLGWTVAGQAGLALAAALWLGLLPGVLRHWTRPTRGVSFMLAVSTASLASLAADVADVRREVWLAVLALLLLALAAAAYAFVLTRFELGQLLAGGGDHWVAGGALAIAALACAWSADAAGALRSLHGLHTPLVDCALGLWSAAALWLPPLLAAEALRRRARHDGRRWATVFPVGMYAVCSFAVGDAAGVGGLVSFARAWCWGALAVWALVALASARRALVLARPGPT